MSQTPSENTPSEQFLDNEVQGVLTGQVPVRSMPVAMQQGLSNDEIVALLNKHEGRELEGEFVEDEDGESV